MADQAFMEVQYTLAFQISPYSQDAIVVKVEGLQARQLWKTLQYHDSIIREVDAVELILHSKVLTLNH